MTILDWTRVGGGLARTLIVLGHLIAFVEDDGCDDGHDNHEYDQ